jgi:hypothetical protein
MSRDLEQAVSVTVEGGPDLASTETFVHPPLSHTGSNGHIERVTPGSGHSSPGCMCTTRSPICSWLVGYPQFMMYQSKDCDQNH